MSIVCVAVITFLLVFVIPTFEKLYAQSRVKLPGPTLLLVNTSSFIATYWWLILIIIGGVVTMIKRMLKKPHIRAKWDAWKLRLPLFGKLSRMLVVSHFTRTFAMLISVGIAMIDALEIATAVANNRYFTQVTDELKEMIRSGAPVAKSLKNFSIFPPIIVELASTGEQVGQLPEMLRKGSDLLDRDIDNAVSSMLAKLEPALTVIMGLFVGLILIGAYLPMFDYMGNLK